jgi:hypothetical protein
MGLWHDHFDSIQTQLDAPPRDIARHRDLGQRRAVLGDQPLPDPPRRVPLLARHPRSASSQESITSTYGSIAGRVRSAYALRGGGTALASAWRTVRRCTRCLSANSRIDSFSTRLSRLICSNSSTLDRATFDLHADNNDVKIRTRGGANIRDDTPPPPSSAITTQVEPEFVKNNDPAGQFR